MQKILYQTSQHRCESSFQDVRYGLGKRICILKEGGVGAAIFTCTVCGKELFVAPSAAIQQAKCKKAAVIPGGKGKHRFWYEE